MVCIKEEDINYRIFIFYILACALWNGYFFFFPPTAEMGTYPREIPVWFFAIKDIMLFALLGYSIVLMVKTKRNFILNKVHGIYFLCFLFYACISSLHLPFSDEGSLFLRIKDDFKNINLYAMIALVTPIFLKYRWQYAKLVIIILHLGNFIAAFGIINKLFLPDYTQTGAIISTFGNSNHLGFFLSQNVAILLLEEITQGVLLNKVYRTFSLMLHLIGIILTFKFASILNVLMVLLCYTLILRKFTIFKSIIVGIFAILVIINTTFGLEFINKIEASMITGTSTTISARMAALSEMETYFLSGRIFYLLFGDFEYSKFFLYDSMWLTIIRNNGFLGLAFVIVPLLYLSYLSIKYYYTYLKSDKNYANIILGYGIFIFTTTILDNNLTSYLNKFPISVFYFFSCGMIMNSISANLSTEKRGENMINSELSEDIMTKNFIDILICKKYWVISGIMLIITFATIVYQFIPRVYESSCTIRNGKIPIYIGNTLASQYIEENEILIEKIKSKQATDITPYIYSVNISPNDGKDAIKLIARGKDAEETNKYLAGVLEQIIKEHKAILDQNRSKYEKQLEISRNELDIINKEINALDLTKTATNSIVDKVLLLNARANIEQRISIFEEALTSLNVVPTHMISEPTNSLKPVQPKLIIFIIVSIFIGAITGVLLALIANYRDERRLKKLR